MNRIPEIGDLVKVVDNIEPRCFNSGIYIIVSSRRTRMKHNDFFPYYEIIFDRSPWQNPNTRNLVTTSFSYELFYFALDQENQMNLPKIEDFNVGDLILIENKATYYGGIPGYYIIIETRPYLSNRDKKNRTEYVLDRRWHPSFNSFVLCESVKENCSYIIDYIINLGGSEK
jgi:hypothetical protein